MASCFFLLRQWDDALVFLEVLQGWGRWRIRPLKLCLGAPCLGRLARKGRGSTPRPPLPRPLPGFPPSAAPPPRAPPLPPPAHPSAPRPVHPRVFSRGRRLQLEPGPRARGRGPLRRGRGGAVFGCERGLQARGGPAGSLDAAPAAGAAGGLRKGVQHLRGLPLVATQRGGRQCLLTYPGVASAKPAAAYLDHWACRLATPLHVRHPSGLKTPMWHGSAAP